MESFLSGWESQVPGKIFRGLITCLDQLAFRKLKALVIGPEGRYEYL